ncbi:unnamed protein product [Ectocarpus sp. CCAP 1310/34]|nr:unnamed protein product [Ectocarpus sp. CCAP 1310/34]
MGSGGAAAWVESPLALVFAVCASVLALALGSRNMLLHARNYNFPRTQKYIFRILIVVPVYAICSCIAIIGSTGDVVVVALIVRDCYEAFVVYSFLTLILEHAGGDYNCIEQIKHLPPVPHPFPLCCLARVRRDGTLLRLSKQSTLQFVVVKPTMAILSLLALALGQYYSDSFQVTLLVVYNSSYSVALYGLLMFYRACGPLLAPFRPVQKFFAVKSIIFATYWQSVVVYFIPGLSSEQILLWNDWLICMELVAFALLLNAAFPWHDFIMEHHDKPVLENVREMINVRDVFQDAYHSFMPSYQDYVVARDDLDPNTPVAGGGGGVARPAGGSGGKKESRVVRTRTFLIGNLDRGNMSKPTLSTDGTQSTDESDNPAAGGGSHPANGGRGRLSVDDEDLEGGLDEDWGHDVNVIELQNRLPDTSSSRGGGKSKPKSKRSKGAAAAAAEVEAAAAAAAAAQEGTAAAAAAPSGTAVSQGVAGVAV